MFEDLKELTLAGWFALFAGVIAVCFGFFGICWLPEIVKAFL